MNPLSNDVVRYILSYITKIEDCQRIRLVCWRLHRLLPGAIISLRLYSHDQFDTIFITPQLITWVKSCVNLHHLAVHDCCPGRDVAVTDMISLAELPLRGISHLYYTYIMAFFQHYRLFHRITGKSKALKLNPFRQNWANLNFLNREYRGLAYTGTSLICVGGTEDDTDWSSIGSVSEYLVDVVDFDHVIFDTCQSLTFYWKIFSRPTIRDQESDPPRGRHPLRRTMVMFRDLDGDNSDDQYITDNFLAFRFPASATVETILGAGYSWKFIPEHIRPTVEQMLFPVKLSSITTIIAAFPNSTTFYVKVDVPANDLLTFLRDTLVKNLHLSLILSIWKYRDFTAVSLDRLHKIRKYFQLPWDALSRKFSERLMFANIGEYNTKRNDVLKFCELHRNIVEDEINHR